MPKKIKKWEELIGLESENYKIKVGLIGGEAGCAWIEPKVETAETFRSSAHHVYLSTHTFYPSHYKWATETLQKFGFDVELVPDV